MLKITNQSVNFLLLASPIHYLNVQTALKLICHIFYPVGNCAKGEAKSSAQEAIISIKFDPEINNR